MTEHERRRRPTPWYPSVWGDREDVRQVVTILLAWGGWLATATLVALRSSGVLDAEQASWTILTIGIAIAASLARSRMRLASTISETFESGIKVATVLQTNVTSAACVIETDLDGVIDNVEHSEVIGWRREDLKGQRLDILIPDRFLRQHQEGFRHFRESGEARVAGRTLNVPTLTATGHELPMRLSVARLGDSFIGTLVPATAAATDAASETFEEMSL